MGRSVETIGSNVVYFDAGGCEDSYDWHDMICSVTAELRARYPSLAEAEDKWVPYPYRENRIVLENDHVQISVSEYRDCGAFSVFINPQNEEYTNLADGWLGQCWDGIRKTILANVAGLRRIGIFSNGEAVYEKIA